jgi:DNA-binding HxlR family transcriptional regulator
MNSAPDAAGYVVAVPDYGKFCPVSMGADVIADRWTPLIMRELILGSTRFNDIARGLPGISRSLLVQRLKHLERKGVLERWPAPGGRGHEYRLTPAGKDLEGVVFALGEWSVHWLYSDMQPHDIDPITLTWWMHHRVDVEQLPPGRVVVQLDYTEPERVTTWIVLDRGEASVCQQHPGYDSDVIVTGTTGAFADVFNGVQPWSRAVSSGALRVDGPPRLARALPRWFLGSPFAELIERQSKTTVRRP